MLGIGVLLAVVHLALPDPVGVWMPLLKQMLDSMAGRRASGSKAIATR